MQYESTVTWSELLDDDLSFDTRLPLPLQDKAEAHFTPVDIARRAAHLVAPRAGMTVLDVGSGVGKFCLVAARALPLAQFVGVEWRPHLVRIARQLADQARLSNVRFEEANALDLDWSSYAAFYLYNPFAEHLFERPCTLDDTIEFDPVDYAAYAEAVRDRLAGTRLGTRVVTYHGFGASPPDGFTLESVERIGTDRLELWVRTTA